VSDIDDVILVGGQTRMPKVQDKVKEFFGKEPRKDVNPDEAVAVGASIQGGILRGDVKDVVLLDVTPLSLGIETHGGLFTKLIDRNSTIPTKSTQIFTTVVDNQDTVEIHVLQGEREISGENKSLGRFELVGIPPAPRGVPQIEVTFAIDSNGIVNVSARDMATNLSQSIQINPAGGLSREEVDRLVEEADAHALADRQRREMRQLKNRLEGLVYNNQRVFDQFREMLDDERRRRIHESLLQARVALSKDDRGELEVAMYDLNTISRMLSEVMLDRPPSA
jgi:molecular chaperone DnaK